MKIVCVSSFGGHFVQMKKISGFLNMHEIVLVSTKNCSDENILNVLTDYNLKNFYKCFQDLAKIGKILKKEKPDIVVSTGAAPGAFFLIVSFCCGKKTIWIDSIANTKKLSISGRIARLFCTRTYSQWENVAKRYRNVKYVGGLL